MKLIEIRADGFRNLKEIKIKPDPLMNVIYGKNAQGKTNLIESIWLFTGQKSFRTNKESRQIDFEKKQARLQLQFYDEKREQCAKIKLCDKNTFSLNHVPLKAASGFCGKIFAVVFSPIHLKIVQESPENRRRFLNQAISQIRPDYRKYYSQYERILNQRNKILKEKKCTKEMLEIWDLQLAKTGTILSLLRFDYVEKLSKKAKEIYRGITKENEILQVSYQSTIFDCLDNTSYDQKKVEAYFKKLQEQFEKDKDYKNTSVGIHRDDLKLEVNELSVKIYGSQGQQRSCVISLKLAESALLKEITKQSPIILLDDVMSELDPSRQEYIFHHIEENQVFITCCNPNDFSKKERGKTFLIEKGMCH